MKSLEEYRRVAHQFAELNPYRIPELTEQIKVSLYLLKMQEAKIRKNWRLLFLTAEEWFRWAEDLTRVIERYKDAPPAPRDFVLEFFYGERTYVTVECILQYAESTACDADLKLAIIKHFIN